MEYLLSQIPPLVRLFLGVVGAVVSLVFLPLLVVRLIAGGLTSRAVDGAKYCPECGQGVVGFLGKCEICGYNPPRN